jgi:hypothetical protein
LNNYDYRRSDKRASREAGGACAAYPAAFPVAQEGTLGFAHRVEQIAFFEQSCFEIFAVALRHPAQ